MDEIKQINEEIEKLKERRDEVGKAYGENRKKYGDPEADAKNGTYDANDEETDRLAGEYWWLEEEIERLEQEKDYILINDPTIGVSQVDIDYYALYYAAKYSGEIVDNLNGLKAGLDGIEITVKLNSAQLLFDSKTLVNNDVEMANDISTKANGVKDAEARISDEAAALFQHLDEQDNVDPGYGDAVDDAPDTQNDINPGAVDSGTLDTDTNPVVDAPDNSNAPSSQPPIVDVPSGNPTTTPTHGRPNNPSVPGAPYIGNDK